MNIQLNGANSKNERDRIDYERAMQDFEQDKKTVSHKHIYELFEGNEGDFVSEEIDDFDDEFKELYKKFGGDKTMMPEIENWGVNFENETMKGYVLYALKEMQLNTPELQLSDKQKDALMVALNWATSDLTAQEAYEYYLKN